MFNAEEYYQGKQAFREGWTIDECPYPYGSNEHEEWMNGFDDAEGETTL
jgi:ribosome modulation factor